MLMTLYARLVLWLIAPALVEFERRKCEASRTANERWKALGYPGGTFQAHGVLGQYWRERGCPGGLAEAERRGLAGPEGKAIDG
ncbi:hypothetical protein C7417_1997 [Cupriavidus plantarum]|nr:hypothetical protein C7417_1997 [Cupriavidus plantarum]